ncbi:MAG: GNAT family N-acetyltransferase [Coriobacteriia bacterium]|nr:GNAT family N-acetyltransferase [Coriobacteriia bacterium]
MIEGIVCNLRAIEEGDLEKLQNWRNKEHLRKFYREYRDLNAVMQQEWFDWVNSTNDCLMFSIEDKEGVLLGACGLTNINWVSRSAELSFYIGKDDMYVDDVYAADAVMTLCRYAFRVLNIHKVWAEIYEFDVQKTHFFAEVCPFDKDALIRDTTFWDGRHWGSLFYSITSEEFAQLEKSKACP